MCEWHQNHLHMICLGVYVALLPFSVVPPVGLTRTPINSFLLYIDCDGESSPGNLITGIIHMPAFESIVPLKYMVLARDPDAMYAILRHLHFVEVTNSIEFFSLDSAELFFSFNI